MDSNCALVPQAQPRASFSIAVTERDIGLLKLADRPTQAAYLESIKFSILGLIASSLVKDAQYLRRVSISAVGSKERSQLVQARNELIQQFYSLFRSTGTSIDRSEVIDVLAENA